MEVCASLKYEQTEVTRRRGRKTTERPSIVFVLRKDPAKSGTGERKKKRKQISKAAVFWFFADSFAGALLIRMRATATRQHQSENADTINSLIIISLCVKCVITIFLLLFHLSFFLLFLLHHFAAAASAVGRVVVVVDARKNY